jgi:HEAT repeat protein
VAVNACEREPTPLVVARATALPSAADLEARLRDLRWGDAATRQAAATALGELGPPASAGIPLLQEAARAPESPVRRAAVDALRKLKAPAALPLYVAALEEDDLHERMWAAAGLGAMGPAAKDAVPALAAVLRLDRGGRDYGPRVEALAALTRVGRDAGAAVPALVEVLAGDRDPAMRRDAASLLGRIGQPTARPAEAALRKAAREDASPGVREAARGVLERSFGGVAPTTLTALEGDGRSFPARARTELAARATDHEGRGLPNERVFFELKGGAAALSPESALTDADGVARTRLLLGDRPGTVTVEARYEGRVAVFRVYVLR